MNRPRRAFHPEADGAATEVALSRDESHHVTRVLRLKPGDPLAVFNGRGREWQGVLQSIHGDGARVRLGAEIHGVTDPRLEVVLFQGLCRAERMEWVIQKATEVGVAGFRPIGAERAEARPPGLERLQRWRRIALEACKQCGRRTVPEIAEPGAFPCEPPEGGLALMLTVGSGVRPLSDLVSGPRPERVWVAVGPEGGFSDAEIELHTSGGWLAAGLGPRTLRTETAGVVAATIVLHAWGDLGGREGPEV